MITVYDRERTDKNVGGNEITLDTQTDFLKDSL